ncbi:MAG: prenyltransferase [Polyangiales bacterium]|nr:prenyltransferase [Myxococcales bacterium]
MSATPPPSVAPPYRRTRGSASSRARVWLRAARPLAQANIALPIAVGVAAGVGEGARLEAWALAACAAFSVLDQLAIVFANDYADRDTDTTTRTLLSGGSGVLVDGSLTPASVGRAALAAALGLLSLGAALAPRRPLAWVGSVMALALLQLYSFAPARLSHRGHGEWLQGLGIGVVLPWVGYYLVTGEPRAPLDVLLPMVLFGVAGNITTAMPDLEGDRAVGKRSLPVRVGEARARAWGVVTFLCAVALASALGAARFTADEQSLLAVSVVPLLAHLRFRTRLGYALVQGTAMTLWLVAFAWGLALGG